ncbi:lysozyme inhibitor LprI family protein [Trinickia sp.]|uniref:lysozyme inhibitor LprI family protein n=1 Tax=Trinickia sp. TaxID=2571163 RepID=UPI003F821A0C
MVKRIIPAVRLCLTLAISAALPTLASAASFDCAAARTPIEHAICDDAQLSALDSELAAAYQSAMKGQGDAAEQLRAQQRAWLRSRSPSGTVDLAALKAAYRARIDELKALPVFPGPDARVAGPTFRLTKAAKQHDFILRMLQACPAPDHSGDSTCEGPAQLLIYAKGQSKLAQTINLANVFVTLPRNGDGPLVNSAQLYDYQGVLNVGDFNFDGNEDFGIQTGNEGSYGGPSYDVYVFDPKTARFVYNDAMSELILETLGFFDVDPVHKRIHTWAKSGCCYHEATTYRVERDAPVAVARHIEDAQGSGDKMKVTDEALVNGKWRSKVHYEPMPN